MSEINLSWAVYAGAAAVLLVMWYLPIRKVKPVALAWFLYAFIVALIVTPAGVSIESYEPYVAPAVVTALMEFMSGEPQLAMSRLWVILTVTVVLWLLALAIRYARAKSAANKQSAAAQDSQIEH
jgi:hypothetical protein